MFPCPVFAGGGSCSTKCKFGQFCNVPSDCETGVCVSTTTTTTSGSTSSTSSSSKTCGCPSSAPLSKDGKKCTTRCDTAPNPCRNGGTCLPNFAVANASANFNCSCPLNVVGGLCETRLSTCNVSNPCECVLVLGCCLAVETAQCFSVECSCCGVLRWIYRCMTSFILSANTVVCLLYHHICLHLMQRACVSCTFKTAALIPFGMCCSFKPAGRNGGACIPIPDYTPGMHAASATSQCTVCITAAQGLTHAAASSTKASMP